MYAFTQAFYVYFIHFLPSTRLNFISEYLIVFASEHAMLVLSYFSLCCGDEKLVNFQQRNLLLYHCISHYFYRSHKQQVHINMLHFYVALKVVFWPKGRTIYCHFMPSF